jgi:hypothetical protein
MHSHEREPESDPLAITRDDAPSAPTPLASMTRYKSGAPVDELLYRVAMADYVGALAAAERLFEGGYIAVPVLGHLAEQERELGYRERLLMSSVDGSALLEEIIAASGLEMIDALRALCELVEKDIIAVC